MLFRILSKNEFSLIRPMLREICDSEESIYLGKDASDEDMFKCFMDDGYETWVVEENNDVLGCYFICPNQRGLGSHVANGGYAVATHVRGRGIGRMIGEHSLERAKELGYQAMQYNFVISTNKPAMNLWESLGFKIVGTIPNGYHRKREEYVDAHILYRELA